MTFYTSEDESKKIEVRVTNFIVLEAHLKIAYVFERL